MAITKRSPISFDEARNQAKVILSKAGWSAEIPSDNERLFFPGGMTAAEISKSIALIAVSQEGLKEPRLIYVSTHPAGRIWRARTTLERLAKRAKGQFEVWSVHDAHKPSRRGAGGEGCPFGLGNSQQLHFLVWRYRPSRTVRRWEPVEVWEMWAMP